MILVMDREVNLTYQERVILTLLLNRLQNEALRSTHFDVIEKSMSVDAQRKWMQECVKEHDFIMTLKTKLQD